MTELKISCPHCGQRIGLPVHAAGMVVNCPTCNDALTVPIGMDVSFDENASSLPSDPPMPASLSQASENRGLWERATSLVSRPIIRVSFEFVFTLAMAYGVAFLSSQFGHWGFLPRCLSSIVCPLVLVFISSASYRCLLWCLLNSFLIYVFVYAMGSGVNAFYNPIGMWENLSALPPDPVAFLKAQGAHWAMLVHFVVSVAVAVVPKDLPPKSEPNLWRDLWWIINRF